MGQMSAHISAASAALAIYRALKSEGGNAASKRILLTSSDPQPDFSPNKVSVTGTVLHDTLVAFSSLLNRPATLGSKERTKASPH
jgi:hypothetical protein